MVEQEGPQPVRRGLKHPYDLSASDFDCHRALLSGVQQAVRRAILNGLVPGRPRILDLGTGTGRIGRVFADADDDYVAVDLSLGTLREFSKRARARGGRPHLVQANGHVCHLPTHCHAMVLQFDTGFQGTSQETKRYYVTVYYPGR